MVWSTVGRKVLDIARVGGVQRNSSRSLATLVLLGTAVGGSSFYLYRGRNPLVKSSRVIARQHTSLLATSGGAPNNSDATPDQAHGHCVQYMTKPRTYSTKADEYFQQHQKIPLPPTMHDNLERLLSEDSQSTDKDTTSNSRILIVGDVHGCLEELKSLIQKATIESNNGKQFTAIVLVGDLCNKGPYSAEVIQHVRTQRNWFSIRGNHDDRALAAALGDEECCAKPKYQWVKGLSDEDVTWMSNLPYTIRIPKSMLTNDAKQDVIIVHAGLDPAVDLDQQETETMIILRNIIVDGASKAWAQMWQGPELIIFGHDAKRGLQREEHAIGLDSGCVYGKKLTGIILPELEMVSVDAVAEHCPIKKRV